MPRHDWYHDDTMMRDRNDRFDERSDRDYRDDDDRGAFFGRGRMDRDRRPRDRGGLMSDESSGRRRIAGRGRASRRRYTRSGPGSVVEKPRPDGLSG